jgi:putative phosphoribosyl transferase
MLSIPTDSTSLIIFAHGSGSSVTSSRNQIVAKILNDNGLSTLLFDLLTKEEQESDTRTQNIMCKIPGLRLNKFNIELLTERLDAVTQWVQNNSDPKNLKIGYFGASTGAAAALYAASSFRDVKAVVSRGGRTDLVDKKTLEDVTCPCLFIVGGNDKKIIESQGTNTKVCFVTAYEPYYEQIKEEYPMIDVGCFIKKPISSNDLIERVKKSYTEIIQYF